MKSLRALSYLTLAALLGLSTAVRADFIAYDVPTTTLGNQAYPYALGMDFTVNSAINVTQLGVFDDHADGLSVPISVSLYLVTSPTTGTLVPGGTAVIPAGTSATLINSDRFVAITPVTLAAGQTYSIVAEGFNATDKNYNITLPPKTVPSTLDTGGGLITFTTTGRYALSGSVFPDQTFSAGPNPFAAGTFQFVAAPAVPEPASIALLGLGGLGLLGLARRRKAARA